MPEQRLMVTDADDGRRSVFQAKVQGFFVGRIEGASRFIEKGVARTIDQHTGKCEPLLLANGKNARPVLLGVKTTEAIRQVRQANVAQRFTQMFIRRIS